MKKLITLLTLVAIGIAIISVIQIENDDQ